MKKPAKKKKPRAVAQRQTSLIQQTMPLIIERVYKPLVAVALQGGFTSYSQFASQLSQHCGINCSVAMCQDLLRLCGYSFKRTMTVSPPPHSIVTPAMQAAPGLPILRLATPQQALQAAAEEFKPANQPQHPQENVVPYLPQRFGAPETLEDLAALVSTGQDV